jgi:hypothetical protein
MTLQDDVPKVVARAAQELAAAMKALQQANALFTVLAGTGGGIDPAETFLLAQIGAELTANYGERADEEAQNLAEVSHG